MERFVLSEDFFTFFFSKKKNSPGYLNSDNGVPDLQRQSFQTNKKCQLHMVIQIHAHTHTHTEREIEREGDVVGAWTHLDYV